jgi:hypothetical protein
MPRLMNHVNLTKIVKPWNLLVAIVLLLVMVVPMATPALAADTGGKAPTTWTDSGVSNPQNVRYSDNQYAEFDNGNDYENCGGFGFAIPTGATINGIEVSIEGYRNSASTPRTFNIGLSWNNGSSWSSSKDSIDLSTTEHTVTVGSASDKWGSHLWLPSDFNDGSFLVQIDANLATSGSYFRIDQLQVKVYYTLDTTPPTVTINQATTQGDPTNASPIVFTVVFSETVSDFATGDVTLSGTAGATTAVVTGSGGTYNVAVSGMTSTGTVIASILPDVAHDAAGNSNTASTSTDNSVDYDTQWKSPSSYNSGGGFSSPSNAYTSNNSYASETTDGQSEVYGTFNFPELPPGSIINGIKVYVEGYRGGSVSSSKTFDVSLSWNNSSYTSIKNTDDMETTPDRTVILGGSDDKWGRTNWSAADFSNANFRVKLLAHTASSGINLDCVMVKVYYTVNNAPVAADDSYSTDEDVTLDVAAPGVLGNDTDADGNPLTAILVSGVSHGNLTLNLDGYFTYVPALDYNGPDSFTYKANDSLGAGSNTATVYITINPVNDVPVAVSDSYGIAEGATLNVAAPGVLGNDIDVDGDTLTAVLGNYSGPPENLTLNSDGSFTYIPATAAGTQDSFTYKANDGLLDSNEVVVTIYIVVPPFVSTNDASDITINSATLNGNLTDMGNATSVQVSFEWGLDANYGNVTAELPMPSPGTFSAPLVSLDHSTTYHFRAKAVGDSNVGYATVYGSDTTFTTKTPPTVVTDPASDIDINLATLNGNLSDMGTASPVQVSFEWGVTDGYGNVTPEQPLYSAGTFSAPLLSLSPGIMYHFRAKAAGDSTVYGNDTALTTLTHPPIVATDLTAGNVTAGNATLYGNLISLGTVLSLNVSFQWADDAYYTSHGNTYDHETAAQLMTGNVTFNADLIDLEPGTLYHFSAKAAGQHGTAYGNDATFSTSAVLNWWNPDWTRRTQVLIAENSGATLIDYQVKVTVPYDSDMQPDFSDVRFVDKYNTNLLSYWQEGCSEDGAAKFWVKVPIIQASGSQRIWMYYGNGNATSLSNIHDTFIWGDDFGNETWTDNNINKWNADGGSASQGVQNGEYHLAGSYGNAPGTNLSEPIAEIIVPGSSHDNGDNRTLLQFPDNYVVETDVKALLNEVGTQAGGAFITARYLNVSEKYEQTLDLQWSNAILNKVAGDDWANLGASSLGYFVAVDKWYELKAVVLREGSTNRLQVVVNNEMYLDDIDSTLSYNGLAFLAYDWDNAFHVAYDNFRVRGYASAEPSITVGGEERVDSLPKWWDTSWKRRAPVMITETSGSTLTDYQVKIAVPYDSDMQPDFADVRFVGPDSNELSYWRESYTGNSTATFWVKMTSIPASGNQTIWMYYANHAAVTASDIHKTFIWGDDFGNETWTNNNIDKLNLNSATQGVDVPNSEYLMQGTAGGQAVARIYECGALKSFPSNYVAEVEVKPINGFGQAYITPRFHTMYSYTPDTGAIPPSYYTRGGMYEGVLDVEWDVISLSKTVDGVWTNMYAIPLGYSVEAGQWYKLGTTVLGNGSSNTLQVSVNDVPWINWNDSELAYNGLALLSYGYEQPFEIAYDNFRVRQYASQEPVVAFGAEEWAEPIVVTDAATNLTTNSATLNGNLISLGAVTSVDVSFEWGLTDSYGNATTPQAMTGNGTFSVALGNLTLGTIYHFRAKAVGDSTVYGDDMTFTTKSPPVLTGVPESATIDELVLYTFGANATDVDIPPETLTFSLVGGPAGATIDSATGNFTWTPAEDQGPGLYNFAVRVSDGLANTDAPISLTVNEVNVAPVLDAIGNKTVDEETLLTFMATATDADIPANTLTFSLDPGSPTGASTTSGGNFTWTPTEDQGPGTYPVTIRVTDNGVSPLDDYETITITVNDINVAPVLDPIGNKTVDEETLLTFMATATDHDIPVQTLTFSLSGTVPAGASITSGGNFTWTPAEDQGPNDYPFDVVVSDGLLTDSETINITVNEVNVAPVLNAIGNKTVNEETLLTFMATATDHDIPANTWTFSLDAGAPAGAGITSDGNFTWTPAEDQGPGAYPVTIRVTDNGIPALDDFEAITITVNEVNVAPVLGAIGNKTVDEESLLTFMATATDHDIPANTLTFSLDAGAPAGASITSGGNFTWTPTDAQGPGNYTFDVVVSDGLLTDSETITITVNSIYAVWDINHDKCTNIKDLVLLGQHWMQTGAPGWIPEDIIKNGRVDISDLVMVGQHWMEGCP